MTADDAQACVNAFHQRRIQAWVNFWVPGEGYTVLARVSDERGAEYQRIRSQDEAARVLSK